MPRHLVLRSIETSEGDRCVDIFQRADGSYGIEGYRRDAEDPSGWFQTSHIGDQRYTSESEALSAATQVFPWIDSLGQRT